MLGGYRSSPLGVREGYRDMIPMLPFLESQDDPPSVRIVIRINRLLRQAVGNHASSSYRTAEHTRLAEAAAVTLSVGQSTTRSAW